MASPPLHFRLSEGVHLRPLEESDAEELYGLIEANRARLSRWMLWAGGQTLDGTREFIRLTRAQASNNDGQLGVVCDTAIAGVVGFHGVDWANRRTSLGYWLGEGFQGQGTMTRAAGSRGSRLLGLGAAPPGDQGRAREPAQQAIPERLGFREGTLRAAEWLGDRFVDNVVYATLAPEWRASKQARPSARQPTRSR